MHWGISFGWQIFLGLSKIMSGFSNNGVSSNASELTFFFLIRSLISHNWHNAPKLQHCTFNLRSLTSPLFLQGRKEREKKVVSGAEVSSLLKSLASGQEGFSWESPAVPWRTCIKPHSLLLPSPLCPPKAGAVSVFLCCFLPSAFIFR